jgi:hypothetical protein
LPNGWALGLVGGLLDQIDDDTGPTADRLNGFKGYSYGLGPVVSYTHHFTKTSSISFALRYVAAIDAKKELDGDPVLFTVSLSP